MRKTEIFTASFRPNETQQLAVEAKLNRIFGAQVYDGVFLSFEVLEIGTDELRAWSPSEYCAPVIEVQHSGPGSLSRCSSGRFDVSMFYYAE